MTSSTRARSVLTAALFVAGSSLACSDSSDGTPPAPDDPPSDAGVDVADASPPSPDADCPTCEWYPESCSAGALCLVNASVAPTTVLLALLTQEESITAVGTHGSIFDFRGAAWQSGSVGTYDALRAVAPHGDELWVGSSLQAVFVRPLGDRAAPWKPLSTRGGSYFGQNRPINGLFGDPQRTWAWAAVTPVCAGGFFDSGVALVRLRREATRLDAEDIIRHDGFTSSCAGLNAIDGTGDAVWAAGDLGLIYEVTDLDSETPRIAAHNSTTKATLRSIWAEPSGHLWASGDDGTLVHRGPGQPFTLEEVPTTASLHAVHGTSPSDVWVVGAEATVLRYDGKTWSRVPVAGLGDRRPTLRAVKATAPDRVWVAGDGVLLALAGADGKSP